MDTGLSGRAALVTGASKGMGRAIAEGIASEGAGVCVVARGEAALAQAAREIAARTGAEVLQIAGDVRDPALPGRAVGAVLERWGSVDILVNNAGGPPPGSFLDHHDEAWADALQLNLMSAVRFTREVAPHMKERGWGRVVNVTSTLAKEPSPAMVLSATARAGLSAFAKAVSVELAPHNITVNTLAPGGVRTDRLVSLVRAGAESQGKTLEAALAEAEAGIPIGRFAEPEEFASAAIFLASEAGRYVTGTTIMVDGGLTKSVF